MSDDGDHYYSFDRVDYYCGNISPHQASKLSRKISFTGANFLPIVIACSSIGYIFYLIPILYSLPRDCKKISQ